MLGSINRRALRRILEPLHGLEILLAIALGTPREEVVIETVGRVETPVIGGTPRACITFRSAGSKTSLSLPIHLKNLQETTLSRLS